jgi:short-subunit dehydrogenase
MKRFCLLGSSRGLGWATYLALSQKYSDAEFLLLSRKIENRKLELKLNTRILGLDFTKVEASYLIEVLQNYQPTDLIYFAGGGPYADFFENSWETHLWSLKLTFLFPAELILKLGQSINQNPQKWSSFQSITVIGSSIAENTADPKAASYCAAKHALKGLISTLQKENSSQFQIKSFSPGYMDTDLLPRNSAPREKGLALSAEVVANELIKFIESPKILMSL